MKTQLYHIWGNTNIDCEINNLQVQYLRYLSNERNKFSLVKVEVNFSPPISRSSNSTQWVFQAEKLRNVERANHN